MTGLLCLSAFPRNLASLVILLFLMPSPLLAKRNDDRVVLNNGDHITGEIKRIERGILFFKPGYALEDIQIDWTRVDRLESQDYFTVGLTDGAVHTGVIKKTSPSGEDETNFTISTPDNVVERRRAEVVTLQSMEKSPAGTSSRALSTTDSALPAATTRRSLRLAPMRSIMGNAIG